MSDPKRILVTGASHVGKSALIALLAETLNDRRVELVDQADIPIVDPMLEELSSMPVRDLRNPSLHFSPTPYTRQSKGERKRNKRNRWK